MIDSFGLALADLDVTPTVRAAAWTPASLSSLVAWFDPSYGVYANSAAKFVAASSQDLRRQGTIGTNYNTDWSVSMWVNPANVSGFKGLFFRSMAAANLRIYLQNDTLVTDGFAGLTSAAGFFASGTWVHVTVTYQGTGDKKLRFYKNGSLNATSSAYAGSAVDNDASRYFYVGSLGGAASHDGSIDSCGYWNRELSAADALALYNSGSGKTYADLTTAEKVSLVSWYDFATTASLGTDAHGSNTLTNTGSVTCDAGIAAGACVADDPVYRWYARNNASIYFEQVTLAKRPVLTQSAGGDYYIVSNGTSHQMVPNTQIGPSTATMLVQLYKTGASNDGLGWGRFGSGGNTHTNYTDGNIYDAFGTNNRPSFTGIAWQNNWIRYVCTAQSGSIVFRSNGAEIYSRASNTVGWIPANAQSLFAGQTDVNYWPGRIGHFVVSEALSAGDLSALEAWALAEIPS